MNRETKCPVLRPESDGSVRIMIDTLPKCGHDLLVLNPTQITCGNAEIHSMVEFDGGKASYPVGLVKFRPASATLVFMGAPLPNSELIIRHQESDPDDPTSCEPVSGSYLPHSISLN